MTILLTYSITLGELIYTFLFLVYFESILKGFQVSSSNKHILKEYFKCQWKIKGIGMQQRMNMVGFIKAGQQRQ